MVTQESNWRQAVRAMKVKAMSDIREFVDDDNRPYSWGICASCGEDANEEDYDEVTRVTTCRRCSIQEPVACDVFERAISLKYSA